MTNDHHVHHPISLHQYDEPNSSMTTEVVPNFRKARLREFASLQKSPSAALFILSLESANIGIDRIAISQYRTIYALAHRGLDPRCAARHLLWTEG